MAYDDIIAQASAKYGVPVAVIKAVIQIESSWSPGATSWKGAVGLMQIMPSTARDPLGYTGPIGSKERLDGLYDPALNIDLGTRYFKMQYSAFGSWEYAAYAYNGGPNWFRKYLLGQAVLYTETRDYVQRFRTQLARYMTSQGGSQTPTPSGPGSTYPPRPQPAPFPPGSQPSPFHLPIRFPSIELTAAQKEDLKKVVIILLAFLGVEIILEEMDQSQREVG